MMEIKQNTVLIFRTILKESLPLQEYKEYEKREDQIKSIIKPTRECMLP